MANEWLGETAANEAIAPGTMPGVAAAIVIQNVDVLGLGRVQIELPWAADIKPWARIAAPSAGNKCGFYAVPQIGDEVLVAFAHGDLREPYVLGSLWNQVDPPPYATPVAPSAYRTLRTPAGHQLEFDDLQQKITISTPGGQTIELGRAGASITSQAGVATIDLDVNGSISIEGKGTINIKGTELRISGVNVSIEADANLQIKAGAVCEVQASLIKLN
jgi:uncharacterized protein involved in type VI secretion and phage assembly